MSYKKYALLLLAMVMTLALVCGCASKESKPEEEAEPTTVSETVNIACMNVLPAWAWSI